MISYDIYLSLSDLLHLVMIIFRSIHVAANGIISFFFFIFFFSNFILFLNFT